MKRTVWSAAVCLALGISAAASAETLYVSTSTNQLLRFDSGAPGAILSTVAITGLRSEETLAGIDFRPLNGQLYGLGTTGRLYTISRTTGAATQVGVPFTLQGSRFGFDFNPTVDRIRIVSDEEQNLRVHPDTGAVVATDSPLAYAAGDVNAGDRPTVTGSAYTNNLAGATTTVLYGIELANNALVIQNPPNEGALNTVGPLGVLSIDPLLSFDISGVTGTGYATLSTGIFEAPDLYRIDLASGTALRVGPVGGLGASEITGLAVASSDGPCIPSTTALCLENDRFRVSVTWVLPDRTTGVGQAVPLTDDSGYFWFFAQSNIELIVKVLDACSTFNRFWVFAGGLTNVGVTVTVVDSQTGAIKSYNNPVNAPFQPLQDTNAFTTCP